MYLRHTTVRKNGKTHSYWRLVRTVRRGRKVVQETVAQLGELDARGRARARSLALRITGRSEQYELFEVAGSRTHRWQCGWISSGWNARAVLATFGSAGGCGRRSRSIASVTGI